MAEWVDKAIKAKAGAALGRVTGAYAASKALEQAPFIGGILGGMVGEKVGRKIAIEAAGGMEYIKSTSDLSFTRVEDLAVYLYVVRSSHPHYSKVFSATGEVYPELKKRFYHAIRSAPRKSTSTGRY